MTSHEGHWSCDGPEDSCKSKKPVDLELEVISIAPRYVGDHPPCSIFCLMPTMCGHVWADIPPCVMFLLSRAFYIPRFLSDYEAEHIIALAKPQIKASQVGMDTPGPPI